MSAEIKYRPDIDGLRAVAVILVIVYHAFPDLLTGGFIGVDIFFIISGYLISTIILGQLSEGHFSFKTFYIRRINRIFPSLILVLLTCFVFGWITLFKNEFIQLAKHVAAGAGFISNIVLWKESGYFDSASDLKPLLHLWSLAIEEQFYIFWPLLLFCAFKYRFNRLILILFLGITSYLINYLNVNIHAVGTFYALPSRFWEFLIGCWLAHINLCDNNILKKFLSKLAINISSLNNSKSFLGLILIFISAFYFNKNQPFPGSRALFPTCGAALLISAGTDSWLNRKVLSSQFLVMIGLISYPLYLWHWPILSYLRIIESGTPSCKMRLMAVFISILLAWLTYNFLEKFVRHFNKNIITTKILITLMTVIGVTGFITFTFPPARNNLRITQIEKKRNFIIVPDIIDKSCPTEASSHVDACVLSIKGQLPTVALIGDSHAGSLYSGLSNFFKTINENLLLLSNHGCVPFFNLASHPVYEEDTCLNKMNESLEFALKTTSIKTIILSSRGPLYTTGKGYFEPEMNTVLEYAKYSSKHDFPKIYESAMLDTLTRLVKSHKEIIFFIDVPELGFDPIICVEPRLFSTTIAKYPCDIALKAFNERNDNYRSSIKSVLSSFPSVKIFDQSKYLCDTKTCHANIDGKIMYRDDDHLSADGSDYITKKFGIEFYGRNYKIKN